MEHTTMPKVTREDFIFSTGEQMFSCHDADLIVRAVNSHDELVSALKRIIHSTYWEEKDATYYPDASFDNAVEMAIQTLAKAEGR